MEIAVFATILMLILFLLFTAVLLVLEIFLAKSERWWPGLLPPLCPFLYALFMCLQVTALESVLQTVFHAVGMFLILNLPTYVLLTIYFVCREKKRKKKMLDKMNIRDLD